MSDPASRLCELARAGDREAAGELISLFYERLYAWLRRLAGSEEDAADLTQKTFARAWAALGSWQGRSSFSTWLHGIGHHAYDPEAPVQTLLIQAEVGRPSDIQP